MWKIQYRFNATFQYQQWFQSNDCRMLKWYFFYSNVWEVHTWFKIQAHFCRFSSVHLNSVRKEHWYRLPSSKSPHISSELTQHHRTSANWNSIVQYWQLKFWTHYKDFFFWSSETFKKTIYNIWEARLRKICTTQYSLGETQFCVSYLKSAGPILGKSTSVLAPASQSCHRKLVQCAISSVVTITVLHLHYAHFHLQMSRQYVAIFQLAGWVLYQEAIHSCMSSVKICCIVLILLYILCTATLNKQVYFQPTAP